MKLNAITTWENLPLIILFILVAVLISGCGPEYDPNFEVLERVVVDNDELPGIEAVDLDQLPISPLMCNMQLARKLPRMSWPGPVGEAMDYLWYIEDNPGSEWAETPEQADTGILTPSGVQTLVRPIEPPERQFFVGVESQNSVRTRRVEHQGRRLFFAGGSFSNEINDSSSANVENNYVYRLMVVDEDTGLIVTTLELPLNPMFEIVTAGSNIGVIYRQGKKLFLRNLKVSDDGLSFDQSAISLVEASAEIVRYIWRQKNNNSGHLLWRVREVNPENGDYRSYYKRINFDELNSPVIHRLDQIMSGRPIGLIVSDDSIYIVWVDGRFSWGLFDRTNPSKIFIAVSKNGGKTFDQPKVINKPFDDHDNVYRPAFVFLAADGLLLFWSNKFFADSDLPTMNAAWIRGDLGELTIGGQMISEDQILQDLLSRLEDYHNQL